MEAVRSSETPVNFYQTTPRHIPEDNTLHSHLCENPQFNYVVKFDVVEIENSDGSTNFCEAFVQF
jgi:hypothetical protein